MADPIPPLFNLPPEIGCFAFPQIDICSLLLPGGAQLASIDVLNLAQPALAPLVPLFQVLEVLVAIKNCMEGVVDLAEVPPNPQKLLDCLPELARKIAQILKLIPALSVPALLITLIDCIISELNRLRSYIAGLLAQLQRAIDVINLAAQLNNPNLNLIGVCATDRVAAQLDDKMKALVVLGRLFGFMRVFLELIGLDPSLVPDFADIAESPLADILAPIDSTVEALNAIRAAVAPLVQLFVLEPTP